MAQGFSKREHTVNSFEDTKRFLVENKVEEKGIKIRNDYILFPVKHGNMDRDIMAQKGETIFFEGVFEDGTTDIWVV